MEKHGFTLIEQKEMSEVGGTARLWQHKNTGASLLSVCNADENKCFGVSFRTPPADSTGVAHILEHSVLCGSDKYPVREPFVELLKGSLQTFLNAFTFPDKTCYPVASANLQDFYNLIDVYLDAVFHPRISEDIFRQEGWHIEASEPDSAWIYKGVVYNEMKGVYSSPDSVLAEQSQQSLFPDTLYSLDSGGNPENIPDLTHAAFKAFHASYYHPSNARFFFWGDDNEDARLARIDAELAGYTAIRVDSQVPLQAGISSPRLIEVPYAAASGDSRCLFTVNWLLGERGDVHLALLMEMLEHILEGLPGSPLRMALISSGLGEDTTGCGLETDLRQMYFSTGLKGLARDDVQKAELLIFETLAGLAENGIDRDAVEAAVNSVEFNYRENNSGRFPQGLAAMIQALSTWLYDGDPLQALAWEAPLAGIKQRLAAGEPLFENAIRKYFLENSHRSTVVLVPDPGLGQQRLDRENARLEKARAATDQAGRIQLVEESARLQQLQVTPDSPEALATIPQLGLADLPAKNKPIPCKVSKLPGQTSLSHELPTRGIAYASILLPVDRVPERLLPLMPIMIRSLTEVGTKSHDLTSLGSWIAAKTGGLGADLLCGITSGKRGTFRYLSLGGKAVYDKLPDFFAILREILLEPLEDREVLLRRIQEMLLETSARIEHAMQSAGNAIVGLRLRARYSASAAINEKTGGLTYLDHVRAQLARLAEDPDGLLADLAELRGYLAAESAIVDCVAEAAGLAKVEEEAGKLLAALPQKAAGQVVAALPTDGLPVAEALVTPAQVNYVGRAVNLYDLGYKYHGSASVILRAMRMGYLWEQVRVRGGAYGASCNLNRFSGTLVCSSYRDPNVMETIRAFDGMAAWLASHAPDQAQLTQAIVGAVGDLDSYLLPDARGAQALARWLTGDSEDDRQRMREEMMGTTASDFRDFAEVLADLARHGQTCVLGGPATEAAARENGWVIRHPLAAPGEAR